MSQTIHSTNRSGTRHRGAHLLLLLVLTILFVSVNCALSHPLEPVPDKGVRYGVCIELASGAALTDEQRETVIRILERRLDELHVQPYRVTSSTVSGETVQVLVPIPSGEAARVKRMLQAFSNLEMHAVVGDARSVVYPSPDEAWRSPGIDPSEHDVLPFVEPDPEPERNDDESRHDGPSYLVVERRAIIDSRDIRDARAVTSEYDPSSYEIEFSLTPAGARRFGDWTGKNIGRDLAIVLDGEIKSAPRIWGQIQDEGMITGSFTKEQAEDLAIVLRSGTLPGRPRIVSEAIVAWGRH